MPSSESSHTCQPQSKQRPLQLPPSSPAPPFSSRCTTQPSRSRGADTSASPSTTFSRPPSPRSSYTSASSPCRSSRRCHPPPAWWRRYISKQRSLCPERTTGQCSLRWSVEILYKPFTRENTRPHVSNEMPPTCFRHCKASPGFRTSPQR